MKHFGGILIIIAYIYEFANLLCFNWVIWLIFLGSCLHLKQCNWDLHSFAFCDEAECRYLPFMAQEYYVDQLSWAKDSGDPFWRILGVFQWLLLVDFWDSSAELLRASSLGTPTSWYQSRWQDSMLIITEDRVACALNTHAHTKCSWYLNFFVDSCYLVQHSFASFWAQWLTGRLIQRMQLFANWRM